MFYVSCEVDVQKSIILVIATRNKGKTAEIKRLLKNYPVEIKDLDDFGPIPQIKETGQTFDDNAYKKASFTARVLGLPALADDSGLLVEALNGAPGVYSGRYAGEAATDEERCLKLLNEMAGKSDRRAAFECVVSIAVPSGPALTYEARCEGLITEAPSGLGGFGYDPIFFYPPHKKTFAELTIQEKNRISHRGKAFAEIKDEFDRILIWIRQHMSIPEKVK
ncbi:MAG: XTP/dITP diphosphatase [Desulfobacterales bacterium]|nr:MAG: XTP/dITP diphosphatase [Desulfobacterales bacterium]UCD91509.1 MAG: XTP/dITP diphosphatase [Desulfobacterales bacterium]